MDKTTFPALMKMEDLINGECTIPEKLDRFFKALIGGKDIRRRDGVNCHRLNNSLASDACYCISNGSFKLSKHMTLGVAFHNFDRYVNTLTEKDNLHNTVEIIYQNVSKDYNIELKSSNISGNLDVPLPPTKRRKVLENLTPVEDNEPTLPANLPLIETIDLLYLFLHFLHVPNTPMGTGFDSKIIKDTSFKQKVSYLTPINFSPTNIVVVKHTIQQAQIVGKECNQTYVQVTYDLAITKIAYKIQSNQRQSHNSTIFSSI
ncbi:hypothetical protein TNCV_280211 [Trichonephila clavipes]|nr:hypothetical protein TNCV_280211 [Trichonephila clavipes]